MRVFVAGATGAIGKQLVPRLVAAGHEVHGMTRSGSREAMLRELGAVPVVADALDADQVAEAVGRAGPDVIVDELTAIGSLSTRRFDRVFAPTNRLRTEGTDHLLSAGQAVGVRRFVAQAVAGYGAYAGSPSGRPPEPPAVPIDRRPLLGRQAVPPAFRSVRTSASSTGRCNGPAMMVGSARADDRWRNQHARQRTQRART